MQKILTIKHESGLHARPAVLFVQTASQFESNIRIFFNGKEANGKSLLSILGLGIKKGAQITLQAEGEDCQSALQKLNDLVDANFGE
jgi:phosphocarrier protein